MKRTLCFFILINIFTSFLHAQTAEADSLHHLLNEAITPFEKAALQKKLAFSLADTLSTQSDDYLKQAIHTSLEIENKKDKWLSFNNITEDAIYTNKIPIALATIDQLAETTDAEKDRHTFGVLKLSQGKLYRNQTNFTEASAHLLEALKIVEAEKDTLLMINTCFNLSRNYYETVPPDSVLLTRYGKMAYAYSTRYPDVNLKATMSFLMGDIM